MEAGSVYGVGMKGKVMDYGTRIHDVDSLQHMTLTNVKKVTLYVLQDNNIVEHTMGAELLDELLKYDQHQKYVIKEFMMPNVAQRAMGNTKRSYMIRELNGFRYILPVVKKHKIIGMPYKKTILFGFEIEMTEKGILYDGSTTRCFVINRKCKEVMSEKKVNAFTETQFVHFVEDILKLLIEIQHHELAHGDIKLDNIMKCESTYELIDWENCRELDYSFLQKHRYLGLSPFYFKVLYGTAWYPSFKVALLKYYRETGGYDTITTSQYADQMIEYYSKLFEDNTMEEIFDHVKNSLDLCAFGMILYGIMLRNPFIRKKHYLFIMNMYKMKNATTALKMFRSKKTRKN
jgi:serine/threonine protein kinase